MARRLSDPEYIAFIGDYEANKIRLNSSADMFIEDLPPWGGTARWGGMDVLVYVAPSGELHLTDITEHPDVVAAVKQSDFESDPEYLVLLEERVKALVRAAQQGLSVGLDLVPIAAVAVAAILVSRAIRA